MDKTVSKTVRADTVEINGKDYKWFSNDDKIKVGFATHISHAAILILTENETLVIGDFCKIRSGCVLYHGAVLGNYVNLGHDVFIRENVVIGDNTSIGTKSIVEWNAVIGNRTKVQGGAFISEGTIIGDDVFIGPHVVTTSDIRMDGAAYVDGKPTTPVIIKNGAKIGANTVILPNVTIGENCLISANLVVEKNVPPNTYLNEARKLTKLKLSESFINRTSEKD